MGLEDGGRHEGKVKRRSFCTSGTSTTGGMATSPTRSDAAGVDEAPLSASDSADTTASVSSRQGPTTGSSKPTVARNAKKKTRNLESRHTLLLREVRPSRLDSSDPTSRISQSEFKGIFNLCHLAGGLWLIANPLYCRFEKGYWIDPDLAYEVFKDTGILMGAWGMCFAWAHTAFLLFKLRQRGFPKLYVYCLNHLSQAVMIGGMFTLIRTKNWAVFPSVFALTVTFLHYMKMHSFVASTLDFETDASALEQGFPAKVTLKNFTTYVLVPSLVYELDYPRAKHPFRWGYFLHKAVNLVITLAAIFLVASSTIIPVFERSHETRFIYTFSKMIVPLLIMDFLFFYMMFETILNMLAEVTDYGDREFYEDWWNCTTWEEFARKWNKPVHEFLLCHVYIKAYNVSKRSRFFASLATFIFSAILHETFLAVCLGFVGYWISLLMMVQIPLIMLSRYHRNTTFGNYYIWCGLCLGVPLLTVAYGREWATRLHFKPMPDGKIR